MNGLLDDEELAVIRNRSRTHLWVANDVDFLMKHIEVLTSERSALRVAIARLKSSNKEMLEALENLVEDTQHCEHDCGDPDCPVQQAREVINSARTQSILGAT